MSRRLKALSKENADRLAAGKPMKMLRGRLGIWVPGMAQLPMQDIHPARYRSEHVECTTLLLLAIGKPWKDRLIHIPNEGTKSKARGGILKAEGVVAGVSDYFLPISCDGYHGLWLEMKASDGSVSDKQLKFSESMIREGYAACFTYGADAAYSAITKYLECR